ncbi:GNAT family N-acetyltransferase [Nocardia sp. 004]|uniref:GNAT family N-acetyltransferase n=1 Tax=Nocardia sp. 004 TaxID=3385978 RepID=UPI0039A2C8B1
MDIVIRPACAADVGDIAGVLATAFEDDPYVGWLLPDARSRVVRATRMFTALTRHHLLHGHVDVAVDTSGVVRGAALWAPPGQWRHTLRARAAMLPGLLRAFGPRIIRLGIGDHQKQRAHPSGLHWYLDVIGTASAVRGLGYGRALVQSRLAYCDKDGVPVHLQTSKESNLAFYGRFGFDVTDEITLRPGGPQVWSMWRLPQDG